MTKRLTISAVLALVGVAALALMTPSHAPGQARGFSFFDTTKYPTLTPNATGLILWRNVAGSTDNTATFAGLMGAGLDITGNPVRIVGAGKNTILASLAATADKTMTFPNVTGNVVSTGDTGTVTNAMLAGSIAASKLVGTDIATLGTVTSIGMGTGAGTMTSLGVANVQTSSSGIGNAADTTDDTLFTYSLPLNSMSGNGKSLDVISSGHFASNGNNKRVKVWFAGTAIVDSAVVTSNNLDWVCRATVVRLDATHASCVGVFNVSGSAPVVTVTPNLVVADLTANASVVKTTGASSTTGAANDVLGYLQRTEFSN